MPFTPEHSLLRVEVPGLRTIDTTSVENLFGMWSLFSKTSHAMENGKRLENFSWRLWNRETFCCVPAGRRGSAAGSIPMPALSSSLASSASDELIAPDDCLSSNTTPPKARPELRRLDSTDSARQKHITPVELEKMVMTIKESDSLEPIDLPVASVPHESVQESPVAASSYASIPSQKPSQTSQTSQPSQTSQSSQPSQTSQQTRPSHPRATPQPSTSHATLESSASTLYTSASQTSESLNTVGSEQSSSTEMSCTHSIVRGFVPGGAPSSYRSQTNLNPAPAPILKTSPSYHQIHQPKKKAAMFTIGTSSDDDNDSSLESRFNNTKLPDGIVKRPSSLHSFQSKKQTSFHDMAKAIHHSPVFESDDEDEEVSESAIEDDDDSSDWEDSDDQSGSSSVNDRELFQRVDSRPDLISRRSLLTTLMHEPDRAEALARAASRSTPAMRRSRTTSPNGPSVADSLEPAAHFLHPSRDATRSRPIAMMTSTSHHQLALSPRTTRRNMLSTELTESLRKNLLWERQHKSTGNLAALKRRHTSHDVKNLRQQPEPAPVLSHRDRTAFNNDYFNAGLGQYHEKGW